MNIVFKKYIEIPLLLVTMLFITYSMYQISKILTKSNFSVLNESIIAENTLGILCTNE